MKIFCVGRNYGEHAKELGNAVPENPVVFMKPDTALLRNNQPFYLPDFSNDVHHEIELVIRINKVGKKIEEKFAGNYFNEIGLGIDFTARDLQTNLKAKGLPWELAKAFDNSAPISRDFISLENLVSSSTTKNNVSSSARQNDKVGQGVENGINFSLKKNGANAQQGNSKDMIFSFEKIVAFISNYFTLKMGDLIYTGTPAGVGKVNIGDKLEGFIEDKLMLTCEVK